MFDRFRSAKTTIYDPPIVKVLEAMQTYDQGDAEFATALENLERLTKLKEAEKQKSRVSPDTIAIVAGNLVGILVMVGYEQSHVMTSKALGLLHRVK
jgi:hypothetical protein